MKTQNLPTFGTRTWLKNDEGVTSIAWINHLRDKQDGIHVWKYINCVHYFWYIEIDRSIFE